MRIVVVKFVLLILFSCCLGDTTCIPRWFDCGNGKCIAAIWHCDGVNDCGNFNDEKDCVTDNLPVCFTSQFQCKSEDGHCIPEKWHCDGEKDCSDGSDEIECNNSREICTGFICRNHKCILDKWRCDGNIDCADGSDEELCPQSDFCENATCSQNCKISSTGPQCYCNDGYALDRKDNKTCNDVNECQQVGFCSQDCTNTIGGYRCSCQDGYELVNRTCLATGADPLLVYSTGKEVRGISLRSNEFFLIATSVAHISEVDVDPKSKRVYWIDVSNRSTIYTAKIDGSDLRSVLSHGLLLPEDIAVDYITNNLYITDSGLHQVLVCKADGRMCHVLHENSEQPRSITLDLDSRLMYWSDWGAHSPGIYKSGMDGSRRISMVSNHIGRPTVIALDLSTSRLYWADAKLHTIEYITLDGTHRSVLLDATVAHPFSLAVFEDTLYWSDWQSFTLESWDKFTGHKVTIVARQSNRSIMGVHVYHPVLTSKASNPCSSNDCSHLCLMSPVKEYSCVCPPGFVLSNDQKTCISSKCSADDFQCKNGRCIIKSRRCDARDDCGDNSDENDCPHTAKCTSDKITCLDGSCVKMLWRCDGENDCPDGSDEKNCNETRCDDNHMRCDNGQCVPLSWICDGTEDCFDGSDERNCSRRCSADEFRCKNDRCILKSWRCDDRDDCGDNSDENDCPHTAKCSSDKITCLDGSCVPMLWRCDGGNDCPDGSDEKNCNVTRCNDNHMRCDNGQCVPLPWKCDGAEHCFDGSDEKNCSKPKGCKLDQFQCKSNGVCIDHIMKCDGRADCMDSSDENDCLNVKLNCNDRFSCTDGTCLYDYEICDGHSDCKDNDDEKNCTHSTCQEGEVLCDKRCIPLKWICDGDEDCSDGSDEENCVEGETNKPTPYHIPARECDANDFRCVNGQCLSIEKRCDQTEDCTDGSDEVGCTCDGFFCSATSLCLPWSKVCDGKEDCSFMSDEGELCSTSCADVKINCSDVCRKTPQGPKCFCDKGFRLLANNDTCEDINECLEFGTCSHVCSNRKGSYKCSCVDGYRLKDDNRSCAAEGESPTLMYILDDAIRGIDLETYSLKFHFTEKGENMRGFDYDIAEKVLYWTDLKGESINSYSLQNNSHDVIYRSSSRLVAVKYDWIAKNIYFLDEKSNIGVCTRNGEICKTLIKSGGRRIDSMAISPKFGFMFWTIWSSSFQRNRSGVIRRAEMDGSHVLNIVSSGIFLPTVITVDPVLKLVYWADMKLKTMECANFNGFKRRQIVPSGVYHPVASAVFEEYIYWIEWNTSTIMRCNKFIKGRCENVTDENVKAHDILVIHEVMQPERHASLCLAENGGCSHLCLTARKRRTCACSDDMKLDVDGQTCLASKCKENEFRCKDGLCIAGDLRCDGRQQCNDGSDEVNCRTS